VGLAGVKGGTGKNYGHAGARDEGGTWSLSYQKIEIRVVQTVAYNPSAAERHRG